MPEFIGPRRQCGRFIAIHEIVDDDEFRFRRARRRREDALDRELDRMENEKREYRGGLPA